MARILAGRASHAAGAAPAGSMRADDPRPVRIELAGVCKAFGPHVVFDSLDLMLEAGGVFCLMAPSGSGKTTLLRILLGLETADAGTVTGAGIGNVTAMFQEDRLCEGLTPVENVLLAMPPRTGRASVRALLEEVLPTDCMELPAMQLSGGMRRRVSLVRAVASPCGALLLDEPFTGLDGATKRAVIGFLQRHRRGRTLLVATHAEEDVALLGAQKIDLTELQVRS